MKKEKIGQKEFEALFDDKEVKESETSDTEVTE